MSPIMRRFWDEMAQGWTSYHMRRIFLLNRPERPLTQLVQQGALDACRKA